ncbi:MAG TPA: NifU family protein [Phycisphaerales bacterium]|nr:NifU family protein [Phycisphaerales bacterium]
MVRYFTTAGGFHPIGGRRLTSEETQSLEERVRAVLDLIRPAIRADGGDLEFVGITPEGVVQIRLLGACIGCPSSEMTLRTGIEHNLRRHVPDVTGVQAVP